MKAYQIKVTLKDVKPPVWREIVVPAAMDFGQFHTAIQIAMGWQDCHLHEFTFEGTDLRVTNDEESYDEYVYFNSPEGKQKLAELPKGSIAPSRLAEVRLSGETKINEFVEQYKRFIYSYDFGDGWEHEIVLQNVIEDYKGHPKILKLKGFCPPEDCGGAYGYKEFLAAWNDPGHPEHKSMREWGEAQGYTEFDKEYSNGELEGVFEGLF